MEIKPQDNPSSGQAKRTATRPAVLNPLFAGIGVLEGVGPRYLATLSKLIGNIGSLIGVRRRKGLISATSENKGMTSTEYNYLRIDISDVPPEATTLTLTVRDLNGNEETKKEDRFVIKE